MKNSADTQITNNETKFKGTQGKWKLDYTTGIIESDTTECGNVVCSIPDEVCIDSRKNWYANALLISKAPEMLEMLTEIRNQLEDGRTYITKSDINILIKEATDITK